MSPKTGKDQPTENESVLSMLSQESTGIDVDLLETARQMSLATKKRRQAKRTKIENDRIKRFKDIGDRLEAVFKSRKERRLKIQQTQWARLDALNKKRQDLEAHIMGSMIAIERHTMNMTKELDAMFIGRVESIKETI